MSREIFLRWRFIWVYLNSDLVDSWFDSFCVFCRLIPKKFAFVGLAEIIALLTAVSLLIDGNISRFDGLILILSWAISIYFLRKIGKKKIAVERSEDIEVENKPLKNLLYTILGLIGIATGSYVLIDAVSVVSRKIGISECIISIFLLALGTSLPELVLSVAAIKKRIMNLH